MKLWYSLLVWLVHACILRCSASRTFTAGRELQGTCRGDVESFHAEILLDVVGRPSDLTDNELTLLGEILLESYNEVVDCVNGAFIRLDQVTASVGDSVILPENQQNGSEFALLVRFDGSCNGCDVNRLLQDTMIQMGTRILPWRRPPGAIALTNREPCQCDSPEESDYVELVNNFGPTMSIDYVERAIQLEYVDGCEADETTEEFTSNFLVRAVSSSQEGTPQFDADIAMLEEAILVTYNDQNSLNRETCDTRFRRMTSVDLCQTIEEDEDDLTSFVFNITMHCIDCQVNSTSIFDEISSSASSAVPLFQPGLLLPCYCPAGGEVEGPARGSFLEAINETLQVLQSDGSFGLLVDVPSSFIEVDAIDASQGFTSFTSRIILELEILLDAVTDAEILQLEESIVQSYNDEREFLEELGVICDLSFFRVTDASILLAAVRRFEDDTRFLRTTTTDFAEESGVRTLQSLNATDHNGTLCDLTNSTSNTTTNGTDCNTTETFSPAPVTGPPVVAPTPAPVAPTPAPVANPEFGVFELLTVEIRGLCRGCDFNTNLFDDVRRRELEVDWRRLNVCGSTEVIYCSETAERRSLNSNEFGRSLQVDLEKRRDEGQLTNVGSTVLLVQQGTLSPTQAPVSDPPSQTPSIAPSTSPTEARTHRPSQSPSNNPTQQVSTAPSGLLSERPTVSFSAEPSTMPTKTPSLSPSRVPSRMPSNTPVLVPSEEISAIPSASPSSSALPSTIPSRSPSTYPTMIPSISPSQQPSSAPSVVNDNCDRALSLEFSADVAIVSASTEYALADTTALDSCTSFTSGRLSRGVWYTVFGNEDSVRASTCSDDLDFDSVISVFRGTSCHDLRCVDQDGGSASDSDETSSSSCENSQASTISWFSESGTTYYILVHGVEEEDAGNFTLTVERNLNPPNDGCSDATNIDLTGLNFASVSGTTEFAFADSFPFAYCTLSHQGTDSPAVWYRITVPKETFVTVSTCPVSTDFNSAISVFQDYGACDIDLCVFSVPIRCEASFTGSVTWRNAFGIAAEFLILVHGQSSDDYGEFELTFTLG